MEGGKSKNFKNLMVLSKTSSIAKIWQELKALNYMVQAAKQLLTKIKFCGTQLLPAHLKW
jgi:hypothetical protein